jgi:hypothetical protein
MAPQEPSKPDSGPSDGRIKPRCALKIGVFGNRHFGQEADRGANEISAHMRANAWDACGRVWDKLAELVREALEEELHPSPAYWRVIDRRSERLQLKDFFSDETPLLTVISSLAAGGDQIGAESALEKLRPDVSFELEAVLPFAEPFYPGPTGKPGSAFTPAEAEKFQQLADRARQIIRLNGRYYDEDVNRRAYHQCAGLVLHHADFVLAIYDPTKQGKPAGTRETVEAALTRGMAVVAVLVVEKDVRIAVYRTAKDYRPEGGAAIQAARPFDDTRWHDDLKKIVRDLLALPHQQRSSGHAAAHDPRAHGLDAFSETVERLRVMSGDAPVHAWCAGLRLRVLSWAWSAMLRCAHKWAHPLKLEDPPHGARDQVTLEPYAGFYRRASRLAQLYMSAYRGAFVWSFALAAVAVLVAVLIIVLALVHVELEQADFHAAWVLRVMIGLGVLKLVILGTLMRLVSVGRRHKYQEHAGDFRYLAELLRPMQWLARLATTVPSVELPPHSGPLDPRRGWTPWLVRAIGRGATIAAFLPARPDAAASRVVTLDTDAARDALDRSRNEWLQGQILYHWKTARQMHEIDDGLEHLSTRLLHIVFGCAAAALAFEIGTWAGNKWAFLHWGAIALGAAAATLPAAIASLGGIMFQSEARRLGLRSHAMYHALKTEQDALQDLGARLWRGIPNGGEALVAAERLRALSKELVEETGHWKVLYQTHDLRAG